MDEAAKKKVDQFFEATEIFLEEFADWIEQQEEQLERDLTEYELNMKRIELHKKYGIPEYDDFKGKE